MLLPSAAARSSLASQGLYYGGYTFISTNTYYVLDHVVSDACLARNTGVECITLMRAQLQREAEDQPGAGPGGQPQGVAASHRSPNVALVGPWVGMLGGGGGTWGCTADA